MKMLRLKGVEHFRGLKENRWGIRELDPLEVKPFTLFSYSYPFVLTL